MKTLMAKFRTDPPKSLGGINVRAIRDYGNNQTISLEGENAPLNGPTGDLVIFDLEQPGNYVAARPSGTEPKVKFYIFAYESPDRIDDLATTKHAIDSRIESLQNDIRAFAESV